MKIKDLIRDLKPGFKPFFILVILYEIVAMILGYPILIIAHKIHMHKYYKNYKNRIKTNQGGEDDEIN